MSAGDGTLRSFLFNVKMVCRVWDGALWEVSDQIFMMTRGSAGMKDRKQGTSSGSANGFKSLQAQIAQKE